MSDDPISDEDRLQALRKLLKIHRSNLVELEDQAAQNGINKPLLLINSIKYEKEQIKIISAQVAAFEKLKSAKDLFYTGRIEADSEIEAAFLAMIEVHYDFMDLIRYVGQQQRELSGWQREDRTYVDREQLLNDVKLTILVVIILLFYLYTNSIRYALMAGGVLLLGFVIARLAYHISMIKIRRKIPKN